MNNMKDYREKELLFFVVANFVIVLYAYGFLGDVFHSDLKKVEQILEIILRCSVLISIFTLFVFLLDVLTPVTWKNKFVYWGRKRPGESIFDKIREKGDHGERFLAEHAAIRYKKIFDELDEIEEDDDRGRFQNDKWYAIYRKHWADGSVWNAQRDYLILRDMNCILAEIIAGYLILWGFYCWSSGVVFRWEILVIWGLELIILFQGVYSRAERFVYNVIANDINEDG